MIRSWGALCVALAIGVVAPARAAAQDGPAPSPIDAALEAFANHDYAAALAAFRAAYELRPLDQIRFNIARCLERMARFREAAVEYQLAAEGEQLSAEQRARAREARAAVLERLGTVVITGPPGTHIAIDGALGCSLPCREQLDPGAHQLRDDAGTERSIRLRRGSVVRLRWSPRPPDPVGAAERDEHAVGPLTIAGSITAGVGAAGIVVFGLLVEGQLAEFDAAPSHAFADRGELFAGLANASIGLTIGGAVLVLIDLLLLAL